MWIHPQVTLPPNLRPDKTYPRNRPPSNAHLPLPPTTCTPLPHTCAARAQIHSQAHPLSGILVIHGLLGQPHPYTQQQTSFPTLISLRFQGIGDSPLHFLPPLQTLPPQILRAIPLIFIPSFFPKNVLIKM